MNTSRPDAPLPFADPAPRLWPHGPSEPVAPHAVELSLTAAARLVDREPVTAADLCGDAVRLVREQQDDGVAARCFIQAADLLRRAGRLDGASALCVESLPLLERLDDRWRATRALQLHARCWLAVGEHQRSRSLLEEAVSRFEKMEDQTELAHCRILMAEAVALQGDLEGAARLAGAAAELLPERAPQELAWHVAWVHASVLGQYSERLREQGLAAEGDALRREALGLLPEPASMAATPWNAHGAPLLDAAAALMQDAGDTPALRGALMALLAWGRRWRRPHDLGLAWLRLARWHAGHGRLAAAINAARRALKCFEQVPLIRRPCDAGMVLADMLESVGDASAAYEAYVAAARLETRQMQERTAMRARMLAVDLEAEEALRRTEQTLSYAQRMSNVGHLVASVNHELNQPMASIRMLAETSLELLAQGRDVEVRDTLAAMLRLSRRLNDVAAKLAAFPDRSTEASAEVRLDSVIDEALESLHSRLAQTPCCIERDMTETKVLVHEGQLVRVIANLVNNALDALAQQEVRGISFSTTAHDACVTLRVADNGPGLSAAARERLFQPFFSTKAAGQGLGLGLALSRDVMRAMGGDLRLGSVDQGAVFELLLPTAPS